jgi:hypothetical protein
MSDKLSTEEVQAACIGRLYVALQEAAAQRDYYHDALEAIAMDSSWAGPEPSTFLRGRDLATHALSTHVIGKAP